MDRLDLRTDRVELLWRPVDWTGADATFALFADDRELEPLPDRAVEGSPGLDRRRSVWYPAPRGTAALSIVVGGRSAGRERLVVPLRS